MIHQLHCFMNENKTAKIYLAGKSEYTALLYDSDIEYNGIEYFNNEQDAEIFCENWVMNNE
jgi:hypothetical protein